MQVIYVGDSSNLRKRIRTNHGGGNVEGSAFRKHLATAFGYGIARTKRESGTFRVRLDLPDPRVGERQITDYVRGGHWKVVACDTDEEANAFQWFAIERLSPKLNRDRRDWDRRLASRFESLETALAAVIPVAWSEVNSLPEEPGVYVFLHDCLPTIAE